MKRFPTPLLFSALLAACVPLGSTARAQSSSTLTQNRLSPHDTINLRIPGGRVIIVYGRPYTKNPKGGEDRTVWGGELVPTGKIWRLGSDEATLLITPKPLTIGTSDKITLPAGVYTLFLFPQSADTAQLVISKQYGEWGLDYDESQDLGRVNLTKSTLSAPVHQFQMRLEKASGGGVIKLAWEDTQFSVPFTVNK